MAGRQYSLLEHIDMCYKYILKHTEFKPDEDLYQDIAADYIDKYNRGTCHQVICTILLRLYRNRYRREEKLKNYPHCYLYHKECTEDNMIYSIFIKDAINHIMMYMSERQEKVLYFRYYMNMTLKDIGKLMNYSGSRIGLIERDIIRRLRRPEYIEHLEWLYQLNTDS